VTLVTAATWLAGALLGLVLASWLLGFRYIPHNKVGVVEKLWAGKGSLKEGRILAVDGEAGFQADLLRGGAHAFFFPWQYRIHRESLVSIPEGKIGNVYSRDGDPLTPIQTLGRVVGSIESSRLAAMAIGSISAAAIVALVGTRGALLALGALMPLFVLLCWTQLRAFEVGAPVAEGPFRLLRENSIFAPLPIATLERLSHDLQRDRLSSVRLAVCACNGILICKVL
jgi:hypothetical protein